MLIASRSIKLFSWFGGAERNLASIYDGVIRPSEPRKVS